MKKFFATMLALVMMLSMSVTAFAATEGTLTLTAEVPDVTWTLTIPADITIPFGQTETYIGTCSINDVSGNLATDQEIQAFMQWQSPFTSGSNTLPFKLYRGSKSSVDYTKELGFNGNVEQADWYYTGSTWARGTMGYVWIVIDGSDWNSAVPGTYTTTITFTSKVVG